MNNCTCHAGKICAIHIEEVMGNLNKYAGGITGTGPHREDKLSDEEMTKAMEGLQDVWNAAGGTVGGHLGSPTPEQIDHEILENLKTLRERATMLEKTCADLMAYIENHVKRFSDVEGRLQGHEQAIRILELQGVRGNG